MSGIFGILLGISLQQSTLKTKTKIFLGLIFLLICVIDIIGIFGRDNIYVRSAFISFGVLSVLILLFKKRN